MNRNRRRDRDSGRRSYGGGMDGLLGEGPGGGGGAGSGLMDPLAQMNQLMLAQQLLQKQAALSGGGDYNTLANAMNMQQMLQQQQQMQQQQQHYGGGRMYGSGSGGGGDYHNYNRKRVGGQDNRDMDSKRRRRSGDYDRNRGGDSGRDRGRSNHSNRRESDKRDSNFKDKGKKATEEYDPADPTDVEPGTETEARKDKDGNLYCHVCSVSVYDDASFKRHLNGTKHKSMMHSVLSVHQMKSTQLVSRLKAEEHLRKIEGKPGGSSLGPDFFCKICNSDLTIPWEKHRYSNIHKQRQLQVKRGCGWCGEHNFNNFTDVLLHRETAEHQKNAEAHGGKKRDEPSDKKKKREAKKEEEVEEDLTIPEFDAESPVGRQYIVQVTGYFCKLCNKFYNNEKSAKNAHCQSETHYEKFKAAMEVKIAEREKRRQEAAEAAAKIKEEEDVKMEEGEEDEANGEWVKPELKAGEDFNDALPIEDSDEEGGLVKVMRSDGDEDNEKLGVSLEVGAADSSLLNETAANESFTYLTGDAAEAHLADKTDDIAVAVGNNDEDADSADDKIITMEVTQSVDGEDGTEMGLEAEDDGDAAVAEATAQVADDNENENDEADDMSGEASLSQEDLVTASSQVAEEGKAAAKGTRGRGTARRARGRGRGKK